MMQDLIIAGASNPEVIKLIDVINQNSQAWNVIGFVDDDKSKHAKLFMDFLVLGELEILKGNKYNNCYVINAIAKTTEIRRQVSERLEGLNVNFATLVHPSIDLKYTEIGYDTLIYDNVVISPGVKIGNHCDILFNCIIAHESIIGDYVFIAPGVTINGRTKIHDGVFIGANATVLPDKTIGQWSMLGAGAVVLNDVPSYSTVFGNPAKVIFSKEEE